MVHPQKIRTREGAKISLKERDLSIMRKKAMPHLVMFKMPLMALKSADHQDKTREEVSKTPMH